MPLRHRYIEEGFGGAAPLGRSRPPGRLPSAKTGTGSRPGGRLRPRGAAPQTLLFACCVLLCHSSVAVAQEEVGRFSVDVKLVNVIATVKNPAGAPVSDLERQNFRILAGGVP